MAPAARASKRKAAAEQEAKNYAATTSVEEKPVANVKAARKPRKIATPKPKAAPKVAAKPAAKKKTSEPTKSRKPASAPPAKSNDEPVLEKQIKKRAAPKRAAEPEEASSQESAVKKEGGIKGRPAKKSRVDAAATLSKLTSVPSQRLNVYAFGTGDNAELGLGPETNAKIVKRPRLNQFLLPEKVGIVALAIGGMHGLALTHDGKVYSWGVNDQCALGRETKAAVREKDMDAEDDSDEEDEPLNPFESTPTLVEGFPKGTVITRIAAGDSISIAVTETGKVYGWGTFRCSDGILGFSEKVRIQPKPILIPHLKNIVAVSVGNDHVLALSKEGNVYAWGNGQQFQLGRRVVERTRLNGLIPREFGLPRRSVKYVSTGSYHSFAITTDGKVWAWGLNQFGQCGIYDENQAGEDSTVVPVPTVVEFLEDYDIVQIAAGEHHSAAITREGDLLMWGRLDAHQLGVDISKLPVEDIVHDVAGKPRYLARPHTITDRKFVHIGCGTHHNIAIAKADGSAWSWGFGDSYQTGQGPPAQDIPEPTKIENTATKDVKMVFADAGGQFSVLGGIPPEKEKVNGVNGN